MKKTLMTVVSSALLITACGGGSGGSSPTGNSLKATAQFDAGNILSNTKTIAETTTAGYAAVDKTAEGLVAAARVTISSASSVLAKNQAFMFTSTKACLDGGSIDTDLEDKDSSGSITSGDTATLTANACKVSPFDTLNGKVVASLDVFRSGSDFSGTFSFTNLQVIDDNKDYTVNGEITAAILFDPDNQTETETVTYNNFSYTNNNNGKTGKVISGSTKGFFSTTLSPTAVDYFEFNDLFAEIPELNGIVKIYTDPRWSGPADQNNWSTGVLVFEGASNSTIKLDAGFGTNDQARLTLDLNGSTLTQTVNWDDLD